MEMYDEKTVNLLDLMDYVGNSIHHSKLKFAPKTVLANDWLFAFMTFAGKMIAAAPPARRQELLRACIRDLQDVSGVDLESALASRGEHAKAH